MNILQTLIIACFLIVINSCVPSNSLFHSSRPSYSLQSYNLSCDQLKQRLTQLNYLQNDFYEQNRFKLRYILIIPAIYEMMKLSTNEANIRNEVRQINTLIIRGRCNVYNKNVRDNSAKLNPQIKTDTSKTTSPKYNYNWDYYYNYQNNANNIKKQPSNNNLLQKKEKKIVPKYNYGWDYYNYQKNGYRSNFNNPDY